MPFITKQSLGVIDAGGLIVGLVGSGVQILTTAANIGTQLQVQKKNISMQKKEMEMSDKQFNQQMDLAKAQLAASTAGSAIQPEGKKFSFPEWILPLGFIAATGLAVYLVTRK